jgi:hypothetical protein
VLLSRLRRKAALAQRSIGDWIGAEQGLIADYGPIATNKGALNKDLRVTMWWQG